MSGPTYVASGGRMNDSGAVYGYSLTLPVPAGAVAGDTISVIVRGSGLSAPNDWTSLGSFGTSTAYWHIIQAGETSWSFTASSYIAGLVYHVARGAHTVTPIPVSRAYTDDPGTGHPFTGITTPGTNCLLALLGWSTVTSGATVSHTPPSGMTERYDAQLFSSYYSGTVADVVQAAAGASGTKTLTTSGSARVDGILLAYQLPPAPTVETVSPTAGGVGGGDAIHITGTGFTADCTVTVGGVAATSVSVVSATSITCVTPAHATGAVDVVVTNAAGSGTLASAFTYTSVQDAVVKLVKGGSVVGSNYGLTSAEWPATLAYQSYGGQADLWGTTLAPADVNASDFGFVLSVDTTTGSIAKVDHALLRVYYTLPGLSDPGTFVAVLRVDADRQTARPDLYKLPRSGFTVGNDPQISRAIDDAEFRLSRIYQPSRSVEKVWHSFDFWLDASPETNTPGVQIWAQVDEGNEFQLLDANGSPATLRTTGPQKVFFPASDVARGYYVQILVKVPTIAGDQVGGAYSLRNFALHFSFRPERAETYDYVLILGEGEFEDRTSMRRSVSKQLTDLKRLVKRGLPAIPIRDPEGNSAYGHVVGLSWREVTFKGSPQKWATVASVKVRMARYE